MTREALDSDNQKTGFFCASFLYSPRGDVVKFELSEATEVKPTDGKPAQTCVTIRLTIVIVTTRRSTLNSVQVPSVLVDSDRRR